MACLGVHFALSESEVEQLRSIPSDRGRLDHVVEVIEETYFSEFKQYLAASDKAWDGIHRALADGTLDSIEVKDPLGNVILGGESLYSGDDYIILLKEPDLVERAAKAMAAIDETELRRRYHLIDPEEYGQPLNEEDFGYTWESFQVVRDLFTRASLVGRSILFTVDQ